MNIYHKFYNTPSALLIFTTLFWAFNTIFGQLAVGEISPLQIVPLRWIFVSSVMWFLFGNNVKNNWKIIKPEINKIVQNRLHEKNFLNKYKIKTTEYCEIKDLSSITNNENLIPGILKTCTCSFQR